MNIKQKKILVWGSIVFYILLLGAASFRSWYSWRHQVNAPVPVPIVDTNPTPTPDPAEPPPTSHELPRSASIKMPFTSQAPFAQWDALHEEACEEASLMMVKYFHAHQDFQSPDAVDTEIKSLVIWETNHGYKVSVTVAELSQIAKGYYGLSSGRVIVSPTIDQLKTEIAAGRPVIVPAAGRELQNPNFTAPGPVYHMLVLKGYDQDGFIVNDPGTRRGESYRYSFERIMSAMHDWDPDNIDNGQKAVLVFD